MRGFGRLGRDKRERLIDPSSSYSLRLEWRRFILHGDYCGAEGFI